MHVLRRLGLNPCVVYWQTGAHTQWLLVHYRPRYRMRLAGLGVTRRSVFLVEASSFRMVFGRNWQLAPAVATHSLTDKRQLEVLAA